MDSFFKKYLHYRLSSEEFRKLEANIEVCIFNNAEDDEKIEKKQFKLIFDLMSFLENNYSGFQINNIESLFILKFECNNCKFEVKTNPLARLLLEFYLRSLSMRKIGDIGSDSMFFCLSTSIDRDKERGVFAVCYQDQTSESFELFINNKDINENILDKYFEEIYPRHIGLKRIASYYRNTKSGREELFSILLKRKNLDHEKIVPEKALEENIELIMDIYKNVYS